jgi:UDP-N-acetyl-L-fucosamine synthase
MKKMRVTTILGTRPEIIRLACIIENLDEVFTHRLIHTGQNFDPNLSQVFFDELHIRQPDKYLNANSETLGTFLGELFKKFEEEVAENPTDAIVILGDTNSALAGIIAKRKGIPVYHLEAGNRSFDSNVPEEINRKIVDHFSDFNLAYTTHAAENLRFEGLANRNIQVIGSPLNEVITKYKKNIDNSEILSELNIKKGEFFLVSAHRQENIDSKHRLTTLVDALNSVAETYGQHLVVTTHPRMKNKLEQLHLTTHKLVGFHQPFGFFDYCKLQQSSRAVLSDSGSVSEESVILGFPAITIRDSMERPEALEAGSVLMSGITAEGIIHALNVLEKLGPSKSPPQEYLISDTANRVTKFISSTIKQHAFWSGLREQ